MTSDGFIRQFVCNCLSFTLFCSIWSNVHHFPNKKNVHFSIIKSIAADAFFTVENFSKIEKDKDDEDESEENEKIQCVTVQ